MALKLFAIRYLLICISLIGGLLIGACTSEERGNSIQESIDRSYLESKEYRAFEEQVRREQQKSKAQKEEFSNLIANQLVKDEWETVAFPMTIDKLYIQNILEKEKNRPPTVLHAFGQRHRYYSLATLETKNRQYYAFMLCKIVGYDDCSIWLATSKNDSIIDVAAIAGYNKSVSYEESSRIQFNENKVYVETVKQVKNPFEQTNHLTYQYAILPSAEIHPINN